MPMRASDSSKFTRWDGDSLRGGNMTHPGIDDGVGYGFVVHARFALAARSGGKRASDQGTMPTQHL